MSCTATQIGAQIGAGRIQEPVNLDAANRELTGFSARQRVAWALENLPGPAVLSSSFGVQAAVMLHMATRIAPGMPVIFVDTGYHFAETYQFVDQLTSRLNLNLHVYSASISPAWQEARHGQRWEHGREGIDAYNRETKVEPLQRALHELDAGVWLSGIRRAQSGTRAAVDFLTVQWNRFKFHPIADWSDRDVHRYLQDHRLPYHPLREQGYLSIGDWHTTRALKDVEDESQLRFFGLMRECGLHGPAPEAE